MRSPSGREKYLKYGLYSLLLGGVTVAAWSVFETISLNPAMVPALILIGLGAAVVVDKGWVRRSPVPWIAVVAVYYIAAFAMPALLSGWLNIDTPNADTMWLVLVGAGCLFLAFYLGCWWIGTVNVKVRLGNPGSGTVKIVCYAFLAGYLVALFVPEIQELPSIGSFLIVYAKYMGWSLATILLVRGDFHPVESGILFGIALPVTLIVAITSGLLARVFHLAIVVGLSYWYMRRRVPWSIVLGVMGLLVILAPVKSAYRSIVWEGDRRPSATEVVDNVGTLISVAGAYYRSGDIIAEGSKDLLRRMGVSLEKFERVRAMTPNEVPYWRGRTYVPLLVKPVPRLVWDEKPREGFGQKFGHRYGFIQAHDDATSVNMNWLAEKYANFGEIGVIVGMLLMGLVFAGLNGIGDREGLSTLEVAAFITIIVRLTYHESNVSMLLGRVLIGGPVLLFLLAGIAGLRIDRGGATRDRGRVWAGNIDG